jgi:hypothetical protein
MTKENPDNGKKVQELLLLAGVHRFTDLDKKFYPWFRHQLGIA